MRGEKRFSWAVNNNSTERVLQRKHDKKAHQEGFCDIKIIGRTFRQPEVAKSIRSDLMLCELTEACYRMSSVHRDTCDMNEIRIWCLIEGDKEFECWVWLWV